VGTAGTSDEHPTTGGSRYQIDSVSGVGHVFGDHGTIHNTLHATDVRGRLEEVLIAARAGGAVERDPTIDEEAAAVDVELAGGTVDRSRIRSLLMRITEAAGAASAVGAAATQLAAAVQSF
jgi:hypothetical protein